MLERKHINYGTDACPPVVGSQVLRLFAAAILLIGCSIASSAELAGTVKTLTGQATVNRSSTVVPVSIGQLIYSGDRIASLDGSYVGVMLLDDTRLTIGPRSEMLIRDFEFNPNSYDGGLVVSFLKGTARVVSGLIGRQAPENVRFHTPTATIGIRGTEFIVDLSGE